MKFKGNGLWGDLDGGGFGDLGDGDSLTTECRCRVFKTGASAQNFPNLAPNQNLCNPLPR